MVYADVPWWGRSLTSWSSGMQPTYSYANAMFFSGERVGRRENGTETNKQQKLAESVRCLKSELCDGQSTQARLLTASTVLPSITRRTVGHMFMLISIEFHTVFFFYDLNHRH